MIDERLADFLLERGFVPDMDERLVVKSYSHPEGFELYVSEPTWAILYRYMPVESVPPGVHSASYTFLWMGDTSNAADVASLLFRLDHLHEPAGA